jgi:predicted nucleotidyltransferase
MLFEKNVCFFCDNLTTKRLTFFPATTRDFIRTVVLKTNPYWPFSRLNEVPYKIALQAFVGLGKKFPEITSVYLRRPLINGSWTPGLSDIDLGVVIDRRLTLDEEFSFLRSFWKNLNTLKKYFPMLGEIEILNDDDIASWIKFGLEGYLARNWVLLYGKETVAREFPVRRNKLALDALHTAMQFYLGYFQDKLNQRQGPPYLVSRDLQRIASKILRCLHFPEIGKNGRQIPVAQFDNKNDMICFILAELEKSIRSIRPLDNDAGLTKNGREWLADMGSHNSRSFENQAFDIGALAFCREAMQSVMQDYNKTIFIVLRDGLNPGTMKPCLNRIWQAFAGADKMPVIVSKSVLTYILRYYDPFQYAEFASLWNVLSGEDFSSEIRPPDKSSFIHKLMQQTATALTFPRSQSLILCQASDGLTQRHVLWNFEKSLFLKLYLEKGIVEPRYRDRIKQCQRHYPDHYREMEALDRNKDGSRTGFANRKWFKLLREMADDIHHSLSAANLVDHLFAEKDSW